MQPDITLGMQNGVLDILKFYSKFCKKMLPRSNKLLKWSIWQQTGVKQMNLNGGGWIYSKLLVLYQFIFLNLAASVSVSGVELK